jgi:hypothetical protein
VAAARVIDQNPSHDLRSDAEEMCPVLPIDVTLVDDAQIYLVHERSRLQGVADSLPSKLTPGNATELRIDEWEQLIERTAVAATPVTEKGRDVA